MERTDDGPNQAHLELRLFGRTDTDRLTLLWAEGFLCGWSSIRDLEWALVSSQQNAGAKHAALTGQLHWKKRRG